MRRRNVFYATGQPGWMRLGYSPGWVGRSPNGLGPCAQLMMPGQPLGPQMAGNAQQRLAVLQTQLGVLEQQLSAVREQIDSIESEA